MKPPPLPHPSMFVFCVVFLLHILNIVLEAEVSNWSYNLDGFWFVTSNTGNAIECSEIAFLQCKMQTEKRPTS